MYWNNPIHEIKYPPDSDIIFKSKHGGVHCLFYDPGVPLEDIAKQTTLDDLCVWANSQISLHGRDSFTKSPERHYDAANLVKINQMVDSVARHGSVKPMLLFYQGSRPYSTGTGDTRLRAIERVPEIKTAKAIISTHTRYREEFLHLREINTMADFVSCFGTNQGDFLIRLTDAQAPWGIDWYEYVLNDDAVSVPGWDFCLTAIQNYINDQPRDFQFTPDWFDTLIDWQYYSK